MQKNIWLFITYQSYFVTLHLIVKAFSPIFETLFGIEIFVTSLKSKIINFNVSMRNAYFIHLPNCRLCLSTCDSCLRCSNWRIDYKYKDFNSIYNT